LLLHKYVVTRFEEHAGNVNSSEVGSTVTVPSEYEALSARDSSFIPESTEEKPPKDSDAEYIQL